MDYREELEMEQPSVNLNPNSGNYEAVGGVSVNYCLTFINTYVGKTSIERTK